VERSIDYVELLFFGELDEVHGVSGDPNRELRIFFRMFHRVLQHLAIQHVNVNVEATARKISVEYSGSTRDAIRLAAQRTGYYRQGERASPFLRPSGVLPVALP